MGVCFFENGSLFFRKWEFILRKWELVFSKMGVCFFVCDLQCDLLISGHRLSRPIYICCTLGLHCSYSALQLKEGNQHFSFKMALLLFLALNIVIVESILPRYVPTLCVNVGLRSRVLVENNQCQLFHLAHAGQCLWQLYSRSFMFNLVSLYEQCYPNRDLNNRSDFCLTKSGNDLIKDYFGLGYTYPEIMAFPCLSHGIVIRSVISY